MKVFREISSVKLANPVATIGIFDGVHLAHQAIINRLNEVARAISGESVVVTLWPHPRKVLENDRSTLKLINTLEEKICLLEKAGVDALVIIPFDRSFASTNFEDFVRNTLCSQLGIHHLVVGYNHQFGKNREGNFSRLQEMSSQMCFSLEQVEPVIVSNEKVSSSQIRKLIEIGNVKLANRFLGYNYYISGKVAPGKGIGRDLGFPTANIQPSDSDKLIPAKGVYAVFAEVEGRVLNGMMNIGFRPTFNEQTPLLSLEVNLFNFEGDLYGKELNVSFVERVRDEIKFNSAEELKTQISKDKVAVLVILSAIGKNSPDDTQ